MNDLNEFIPRLLESFITFISTGINFYICAIIIFFVVIAGTCKVIHNVQFN